MIHITPINDLKEHEEETTCHCQPTIKEIEGTGEIMVIHNSYDGREYFEEIEAYLNEKNNQ